jgi:hypothetical protein
LRFTFRSAKRVGLVNIAVAFKRAGRLALRALYGRISRLLRLAARLAPMPQIQGRAARGPPSAACRRVKAVTQAGTQTQAQQQHQAHRDGQTSNDFFSHGGWVALVQPWMSVIDQ